MSLATWPRSICARSDASLQRALSPFAERVKKFAEARPVIFVRPPRGELTADIRVHLCRAQLHPHSVYCVRSFIGGAEADDRLFVLCVSALFTGIAIFLLCLSIIGTIGLASMPPLLHR